MTSEVSTGREHWLSFRDEIEARTGQSDQLPRVDVFYVSKQVIKLFNRRIKPELDAIRALLSDKMRGLFDIGSARLIPLALALFYAQTQLQVHGNTEEELSDEKLKRKLRRGRVLRKLGFHWLGVLVGIGVVSQADADKIRAGRGHLDTAADLQRFGQIFDENWTVLAPLIVLQPDPQLRLDRDMVTEMGRLGTELVSLLGGEFPTPIDERVDWRRQVIALFEMLDEAYHVTRQSARFHLEFEHRDEEANRLVHLLGMRRPTTRKKQTDETATTGEGGSLPELS